LEVLKEKKLKKKEKKQWGKKREKKGKKGKKREKMKKVRWNLPHFLTGAKWAIPLVGRIGYSTLLAQFSCSWFTLLAFLSHISFIFVIKGVHYVRLDSPGSFHLYFFFFVRHVRIFGFFFFVRT